MTLNFFLFKEKCEVLFKKTNSILVAMYVLGFVMERKNERDERILVGLIDNPVNGELKPLWDEDTWASVRRGSEHVTPTDEEECDPFPLSGILFVMRQLQKTVELNHPDWGIFYIIGEALGRFNSNGIKQIEFEYFLSQLPVVFVERHADDIQALCNYFDEKGMDLHLAVEKDKVISYFTNR
ncbi:hypothetical protein CLV51_1021206 [Chitinophaga niastensis]|uniref:Uncharacterized protein n=1 Tax=Chitinophaga niastensis TaxID=536980 RepID=A0A2P8HQ50_CHINA|nr:hypothetical protein [Chitinophaga niastensis]PSL48339.1 hypothetical protein CLV51_1021206 [Chitinophaga niastensis]